MKNLEIQEVYNWLKKQKSQLEGELLILNATQFFDGNFKIKKVEDLSEAINDVYTKGLRLGKIEGRIETIKELMKLYGVQDID